MPRASPSPRAARRARTARRRTARRTDDTSSSCRIRGSIRRNRCRCAGARARRSCAGRWLPPSRSRSSATPLASTPARLPCTARLQSPRASCPRAGRSSSRARSRWCALARTRRGCTRSGSSPSTRGAPTCSMPSRSPPSAASTCSRALRSRGRTLRLPKSARPSARADCAWTARCSRRTASCTASSARSSPSGTCPALRSALGSQRSRCANPCSSRRAACTLS
mmetsp:Transcript_6275/g.19654  ORF Transcript_6275/g.19654 Transcript_6275/m.19654 type:complete len:224 (-) Transcript_6275:980-1651(-)